MGEITACECCNACRGSTSVHVFCGVCRTRWFNTSRSQFMSIKSIYSYIYMLAGNVSCKRTNLVMDYIDYILADTSRMCWFGLVYGV
jgi:hypothetical protein